MTINSVVDYVFLMDGDERISSVHVELDEEKTPREQCCYIYLNDDITWSDEIADELAKDWNLSIWNWSYVEEYNTKAIKITFPIQSMSFHAFENEVILEVNGEDVWVKES